MKSIDNIHTLALQYFNGTIASEDEKELFNLLEQTPEAKSSFRKWEREWVEKGMDNPTSEILWKKMQNKMEAHQVLEETSTTNIKNSFFRYWVGIASCVAVFFFGLSMYLIVESQSSRDVVKDKYFTCSAPKGGKSKVELPDGSVVALNAGSSLRYAQNFGLSDRTVILDGEGYFEVAKNNGHEFKVVISDYTIAVKGTKFNVSSYRSDQFVTTSLIEGAVEVIKDGAKYNLHPGEGLTLDRNTGKFSMKHSQAKESMLWLQNQMDYSDITLRELTAKLSREYNVTITIAKSAQKYTDSKMRISLKNNETIDEIIVALEQILPVTITKKNQNIVIE